jgi:TRAP-type uncharacterized transport system substrate-binding protein
VTNDTSKPAHRASVISAKGIDLDSLEEMMNRRLRMIWVKHTWFVGLLALAVVVGLVVLTVFLSIKETELRIAVGPAGSEDVRFVDVLGQRLKADKAPFEVISVVKSGPVDVADIHGKTEFDLAVVRGNMKLSNDWPVVAILRQDAVALMVPPDSARKAVPAPPKPAKGAKAAPKPAKIENVSDLAGKRVAIVSGTDGGAEVLDVILGHYGVPKDSVIVVPIELSALKAAIHDNKIDAVLVAGPQTGKTIENTVVAASNGKEGPTFIAIDQAEGIGKRTPPYEALDVPAGAFGGVPPMPGEELKTLSFPLYLVARKDFNPDKIAQFSKSLYASRKAFAYELPGVIAIQSPSTDKDAATLVHTGTADYLGDNTKTFFDRYGDQIFYGLLIGPLFLSGLAGVAGYFRADKNTKRVRQLHRLLQLVRRARTLTSVDELDALQDEADVILGETIQQCERGQLDEIGLATFTLAIDQARQALSEQRSLLVLRPEQVPQHKLVPRAGRADAEAAE